ncbi:tetraacyldisaccharide 4'-kinase [Aureimonas sp. AU12]|uniref:tetraacyldisaccharide 4'-kinase n=1 Tax=Aureimonas sp. AU12 TaxID=1638161 RepID=UPI0007831DAD|nr:tetraacyldisaccharide 4'-kinase [Aureimonas sp. AU12]
MLARAPAFWWHEEAGWQARILGPAAALYGAVSGRRMARGVRAEAGLPVICVGNFTVGGGGKTPTALALGRAALALGRRPGFLTRGHGGRGGAAVLADPARHDAARVGDEAMLLAALAPTAVAADRLAGARLLAQAGCDLAIMDDGFQSARLRADLSLIVVDAGRGLGNGRVLPAGPLRAPLGRQLADADALLAIGEGRGADQAADLAQRAGKPLLRARSLAPNASAFAGQRVLAFCGIADPSKFHRSLEDAGAEIVASTDFPDHHMFTPDEARALLSEADSLGLMLATTAKDHARLGSATGVGAALGARASVLEQVLRFEHTSDAGDLVTQALQSFARRSAS